MLTLAAYCESLTFNSINYLPDDNQLWYIDDQPDGSCMIVCKRNRKVLACTSENESKIVIEERSGGENQKWLLQNGRIVSKKYLTEMCGRIQDSQAILAFEKRIGCELCCLKHSVSS